MNSSMFEEVMQATDPSPIPAARKRRALVVGDDPLMRMQLTGLLESDGYQTITFSSGREAREALLANHFDLVISDLGAPGGEIQSMQLLDWVRKKSAARIIQITNQNGVKRSGPRDLSSADAIDRPDTPLPDRLLVKPFKPVDLRNAVASCFAPVRGLRQILTFSKPERSSLKEVNLDPDRLDSHPSQEILVEAGHGSFELLCAAQDPLPISKIRSLQRLGIRLWTRAA